MTDILIATLSVLLLGFVAHGCGRLLCGGLRFDSTAEEVSLCSGLGLGVLSHVVFGLGLLGLLYRPLLKVLLLLFGGIAVALAARPARRLPRPDVRTALI